MTCLTTYQALDEAKYQLAAVTETPSLDAEVLLSFVLGAPRSDFHTWPEKLLAEEALQCFREYLARRRQGEPVAYLTGTKEFWSLELEVSAATLIPRPETEMLVETALTLFPQEDAVIRAADLGTGSGAIALALANERPHWEIHATDISESALQIARKNAQQFGFRQVFFHHGSWCNALPPAGFDVIVSNPPYLAESEWPHDESGLAFEPRLALVAGKSGLEAIHLVCHEAKAFLKPGGYLLLEHGFSQARAVREHLDAAGYRQVFSIPDWAGHERVAVGRYLVG